MKILRHLILSVTALGLAMALLCSAAPTVTNQSPTNKSVKVTIVNFKTCVEQSKSGKQEQASFDGLKKKMESTLEEKEKTLTEIANKLEDPDYVDSLSPEAETEMKRKFRALNQELSQLQNQYMQALNQTNVKVIQKLNELINKASTTYAQKNNVDAVLNSEGAFYSSPDLDISKEIIVIMDQLFEKEATEAKIPLAS